MSYVHALSIFILKITGYSLTFQTSHFLNGSIHHRKLVSGGSWLSLLPFQNAIRIQSHGFVPMSVFFTPVHCIHLWVKAPSNHRDADKHNPQLRSARLSRVAIPADREAIYEASWFHHSTLQPVVFSGGPSGNISGSCCRLTLVCTVSADCWFNCWLIHDSG